MGYAVCNHGYCFSGNTLPTECESNGGKIIGMICYVGTAGSVVKDENNTAINTYKGLIIGKTDASGFAWADNNNNTRSTSNSRITSAYANSSENCYNDLSGIWYTERMNNSSTWGESYAYYAGGKAISIGNDFVNGGISGLTSGWFLPSIGQWYRALNGIYKSEVFTSSTAINVDMGTDSDNWKAVEAMSTALVNAGCTGLSGVISGLSYYWTSSEYDSNNAVNLLFHSSEGVCVWKLDKFYESAYSDVFVRPFLAF